MIGDIKHTWEIIVILYACNSGISQGRKSTVYIMVITIILYISKIKTASTAFLVYDDLIERLRYDEKIMVT